LKVIGNVRQRQRKTLSRAKINFLKTVANLLLTGREISLWLMKKDSQIAKARHHELAGFDK